MIKYIRGDATVPVGEGNKAIIHIVNSVGGWGAGFVVALSRKWSAPESRYRGWHRLKHHRSKQDEIIKFSLGEIQVVDVEPDVAVINMLAQKGYSYDDYVALQYDALEKCLTHVNKFAVENQYSLHGPKFGAGLSGGDWLKIERMINTIITVPITIYVQG